MSVMILGIGILVVAALVAVWASQGATDGPTTATDMSGVLNNMPVTERVLSPTVKKIGAVAIRISPIGRTNEIRRRIKLAGRQGEWSVEAVMMAKLIGLAAGVLLGGFFFISNPAMLTGVLAAILIGCGYFMPDFWLAKKADAHQLAVQQALPDILDQITISVEAGLGFEAALQRVVRSNDSPLADEIGRMLQDIRLGMSRGEAFQNLLERTDVQDLRLFVRALTQAERSGVPIASILRIQSEEVRERRKQRAEERAMRMPVLLVFPLALCILPSLLIVLLGPAVLKMIDNGLIGG